MGGDVDVVVLRDGVREEHTLTREFVPDDHEMVLIDPSQMRRMPVEGAWLD